MRGILPRRQSSRRETPPPPEHPSPRQAPPPVRTALPRVRATLSHKGRGKEHEMTSPDLPAELKAALDGKLRGFSRNDAASRSATVSKPSLAGGGPGAIRSGADALAYALARMPAAYAAVTASLNALVEIRPDLT